jgi:hypothetical protein
MLVNSEQVEDMLRSYAAIPSADFFDVNTTLVEMHYLLSEL